MGDSGYKIRNQEGIHFITFAVVGWIDVFSRPDYKDIVVDSMQYCQKSKGLNIHAWIIMSNHLHLIISSQKGHKLSDILRDFKKYTSLRIIEAIEQNTSESRKEWMLKYFRESGNKNVKNTTYQFWQQNNHPVELTDDSDMISQRLEYIHNNPVHAGIVNHPSDYIYSSARDYEGDKGLINIDFLD